MQIHYVHLTIKQHDTTSTRFNDVINQLSYTER